MEALNIIHQPPGYKMSMRVAAFAEKHVVIQTGEFQAISLNEDEVKQVISWLQNWLNEEAKNEMTA
jgi:hypothetical protein